MNAPDEIIPELFSTDWFDEAFQSVSVHPDIRKFSQELCKTANIKGICDPGFIANLVESHLCNSSGRLSIQSLIASLKSSYGKSDLPAESEIEAMIQRTIK